MMFAGSMREVKHTLRQESSILSFAIASMLYMPEEKFDLLTLSGRVGYAMHKSGQNAPKVAKALGISRPAVDQWNDGQTKNIKNELLFKLADLTGFSARWIATGDLPMIDIYSDPRILHVAKAMSNLPEYARDELVKNADSVAQLVERASPAAKKR